MVSVPELGGEVIVRSQLLSDHLALLHLDRHMHPAETLARAVRDNEDEPIYTTQQWERFGSKHPHVISHLMDVFKRISVAPDEKKEEAPS